MTDTKPTSEQPAATEPPPELQPDEQPPVDQADEPDEAPASAGLQLEHLEHCPTPGLCFPYGLAADTSHAVCVHGETHATETS